MNEVNHVSYNSKLRTICFVGDICEATFASFIEALTELESRGKSGITLFINSGGGYLYDGLAMFDAIKSSPCKVVGVVIGCAMSSAALVMQACHKRLMAPNSVFMIHVGTTSVSRKYHHEAVTEMQEYQRLEALTEKLLSESSGKSIQEIQDISKHGAYLDPEQAMELGFIDGVFQGRGGIK